MQVGQASGRVYTVEWTTGHTFDLVYTPRPGTLLCCQWSQCRELLVIPNTQFKARDIMDATQQSRESVCLHASENQLKLASVLFMIF